MLPPSPKHRQETPEAFRQRMAKSMTDFYSKRQKADKEEQERYDKLHLSARTSPPVKNLMGKAEMPARKYNEKRREAIDEKMRKRPVVTTVVPTLGISNRPGYGYDKSVFEKMTFTKITPSSLPPNRAPLKQAPKKPLHGASQREWNQYNIELEKYERLAAQELLAVQGARIIGSADKHLDGVHGLFIPGGQDREEDGSQEKTNREAYEQALISRARKIGMPILAVCGGSRALARGFGGQEQWLSDEQALVHQANGTGVQAHPLHFTNLPNSQKPTDTGQFFGLLGGAAFVRGQGRVRQIINRINAINSTHEKVVAFKNGEMIVDEKSKINGKPELIFTVWDGTGPTKTPEGFETRYGAPIMGITSHPEAISGTSSGRNFGPDAQSWSNNIFSGFAQSMLSYAAKRRVISELTNPQAAKKVKFLNDNVKEEVAVKPTVSVKPVVVKLKMTDDQIIEKVKTLPGYTVWFKKTYVEQYKKENPQFDYD